MRSLIQLLLALLPILYASTGIAQRWTVSNPASIEIKGSKDIVPQRFVVYNTDYTTIKEVLWSAPLEDAQPISTSPALIMIGLADGSTDIFRMVEYVMMEPGLSARYPDIKTFKGESISNPQRTIRADWTLNGLRAVIRDENGIMYIDPYQRNDLENRIVYYTKDNQRNVEWSCGFDEKEKGIQEHSNQNRAGDCQFRSYRLAMAATGEYSNFFGATSAAQSAIVLSEIVTCVDRLNDVYEADLAVRLVLIGNTDAVFYYDPATDPYTGGDACAQLPQNQTAITNAIGSANYDVGHVVSTGSGGCAGLGVICNSTNKARGATGITPPTGDNFFIDYVAHELGHEFGGNHTFNGTAGSCNGNRAASAAYEVGSGTTIMAYAGICGAQDVQPHSDPYFHAKSIEEISAKLTGTSCAAILAFGNTAPVVTPVSDYTIPISTPFVLTGVATDPNGDPLTYCWEQYDLEVPTSQSTEPPTSNDPDGPLFRSLNPTTSPSRYIPRLSDLTTNTNYMWEVLPSVTRPMNFRLTVRDYHNVAGCTKEDNIVVTANAAAGPFTVTSQNTVGNTWPEGSVQIITWNVANSTAAPVSCANVDIRLSLDGGFTYPTALLLNEPNDGSANISVPPGTTNQARIMVKGSNNIFFDINNANITITPGIPNFTITLNPNSVTECNDGSVGTTVIVGQFMGFNNPVTLSLLNPPPGAIVSFVPQVLNPGSNSTLTISNLQGLFGTYTPIVRGTSTTGNIDATFTINLLSPTSPGPTLISPVNNATNADILPLLDWAVLVGTSQYEYQIATDPNFNVIVQTGTPVTDLFQLVVPLLSNTTYYWRVRGQNICGISNWSTTFTFTTVTCVSLLSTNVPVVIPATAPPITVNSTLTIPNSLTITDLNVITMVGTHTYINDLRFTLLAPNATSSIIWNQPCGDFDNFNINFDDEAPAGLWPCPATNGGTYRPSNPLTPFDGLVSSGIWTLQIQDLANLDGGSLTSWGVRVCGVPTCQLIVSQTSGSGPGSLAAALSCAVNGDSIKISASLAGQTIDVGASPIQINKNVVIVALGANTSITTSGIRVFEVANATTAQFSGMTIRAGTSMTGGAINNAGNLTLKNVTILKNPVIIGATLIQDIPGSQLFMNGNCAINQGP